MTSNIGVRRAGAWMGMVVAMGFASMALAAPDQAAVWNGKVAKSD